MGTKVQRRACSLGMQGREGAKGRQRVSRDQGWDEGTGRGGLTASVAGGEGRVLG